MKRESKGTYASPKSASGSVQMGGERRPALVSTGPRVVLLLLLKCCGAIRLNHPDFGSQPVYLVPSWRLAARIKELLRGGCQSVDVGVGVVLKQDCQSSAVHGSSHLTCARDGAHQGGPLVGRRVV